jgi:glycine/D-amino acid oxidase-like deaminating enzyme
MRERAQTVIVGAGIVGAGAAFHLAELGQPDVLVVDQGPLFETGGSTSHAPGLVFQTNPSRTTCRIAQDTVALYRTLELDGRPCWYGVGSLEVATTPERQRELWRRLGWGRAYGIDGGELLTPAEAAERVPLLDPGTILGAYHVPGDGIARAVDIATVLARRAAERGAAFEGGVTVTGFETDGGRVRAVATDRGRVECERVLICAGIWGPTVGAMAGVAVPLLAVQHQLVWTDPLPELAGETREVVHPILRHQDMAMYFRHRADHYAVGNYRHEPIAVAQRDLPRPHAPGDHPGGPPDPPDSPGDHPGGPPDPPGPGGGTGRVLLARADLANPELAVVLRDKGWATTEVVAYHTVPVGALDPAARRRLDRGEVDWVAFTASSTVEGFLRGYGGPPPPQVRVAAIGPVTADAARAAGIRVATTAADHTIGGLVAAIERAVTG